MNKLWPLLGLLVALTINAEVYSFKSVKSHAAVTKEQSLKNGGLEISFSIASLKTKMTSHRVPYNDGFEGLEVEGLENMHKVGAPALPFHSMLLIGRPGDFQFEMNKGAEYKLNVLPAPYQKAPCRCEKEDKEIPFSFDAKAFENSGELVQKVSYIGDYRGVPLTHVILTPFQYKDETLYAYPELKVYIKNKKAQTESFSFDQVTARGKKYVIFSPNEFHGALSRLVDHKAAQGYEMSVVSMEDLGRDYDSIKKVFTNFIKKRSLITR